MELLLYRAVETPYNTRVTLLGPPFDLTLPYASQPRNVIETPPEFVRELADAIDQLENFHLDRFVRAALVQCWEGGGFSERIRELFPASDWRLATSVVVAAMIPRFNRNTLYRSDLQRHVDSLRERFVQREGRRHYIMHRDIASAVQNWQFGQ